MPALPLIDEPALEGVRSWGKVLKRGSRNTEAVRVMQNALNRMGETLVADGDFGRKSKTAVKRFQRWAEMNADGVFGPRSLHVLSEALLAGLTYEAPPPVVDSPPTPSQPSEAVAGLYPTDHFPGVVALTFDDGPNPRTTPKILDALAAAGAKGTFFILGKSIRYAPEVLVRAVAEGHTLAHHSWDHPKLDTLSPSALDDQLKRTQSAVNGALGADHPLTLVRPPYGRPFFRTAKQHRPKVAAAFARANLRNIMWNVDTEDWRHRNAPQKIVKGTGKSLRRRQGVVLMHDIHRQTVAALPEMLENMQTQGLGFTTVEALLEQKYGPAPGSV
jgi:peptidoglycan/xylan/chitin deacetylase (PgdA/CDA1 family)